jgi:hypothetical protein
MIKKVKDENAIVNTTKKKKITVTIKKGKEEFSLFQLFDDISSWMEHNEKFIAKKHLPFAYLAIGDDFPSIGAFMFGFFVSKALMKNNVEINIKEEDLKEKKEKPKDTRKKPKKSPQILSDLRL